MRKCPSGRNKLKTAPQKGAVLFWSGVFWSGGALAAEIASPTIVFSALGLTMSRAEKDGAEGAAAPAPFTPH